MSADSMIVCLENPEDFSKKTNEIKRVVDQVTKYKPGTQSIVSFCVRHVWRKSNQFKVATR